jgi:hypothetical protein
MMKPREGLTVADVEAFLADRKAAAKLIDPQNCEVIYFFRKVGDPYCLFDVPDEWSCIGREYFARNLPDGSWACLNDLPSETGAILWKRMGRPVFPPLDEPF